MGSAAAEVPLSLEGKHKAGLVQLLLHEIFFSLQGESTLVGKPTVFVRLTGCPLRCRWCDTAHAFHAGKLRSLESVLEEVDGYGARYVCVTGGEPLGQEAVYPLLESLVAKGYVVSLETSGALSIDRVPEPVLRIVDVKCPGSREVEANDWKNLSLLRPHDQVKFVLSSREDFDWATAVLRREALAEKCTVLFSPVEGELAPKLLAEWVLAERLPVTFQLQLHKILWGAETRGV